MTILEKSYLNPNYYISLELTTCRNRPVYVVQVCPIELREPLMCGHPEREARYPCTDRKKALAAFNRYKKKYI